jgi:hypothetical protein
MAVGAVRMKTNVLLSFDRNPFTNCTRNDSYLYDAHHPHPRLLAHTLWFLHVPFFLLYPSSWTLASWAHWEVRTAKLCILGGVLERLTTWTLPNWVSVEIAFV